ncbi:MAG: sulfotransferase domain-containing protein [Thaumarchaeota archaeon]|nr:sulfotransferase domain-containing protein [Nitrososphaerota archaeon]
MYSVIFNVPNNAKYVILGYRVNKETPVKGDVILELQDIKSIKLEETTDEIELFDDRLDFDIPNLPSLTQEQEKILEKKMVWILGWIRSGSTWLAKDLLNHPSNSYWHEPYIGWHLDVIQQWHYGDDRYFFSRSHMKNILPALKQLILARTYSQVRSFSQNIVIKEPNGSGAADIMMNLFQESKLIFLLRDGRDVVDSIMDAHQINSWNKDNPITKFEPLQTENMRHEAIIRHSKEWVRITETVWKAYQNHNPVLRHLVKYENLINNTLNEVKKIYNFIGIITVDEQINKIIDIYDFHKIPDSEKGSGKFFRSATPGTWKKNFSKEEQELMNSIMLETLKKMEYELY